MLITCHWSATGPQPVSDYHVEFALTGTIAPDLAGEIANGSDLSPGGLDQLKGAFNVWKFMDFDQVPMYATWHLNRDPRGGETPNVSIAALCMGGDTVRTTGPWGTWPFTWAHAYIMAGIVARIAALKGLDTQESFSTNECVYSAQMNGPIYVVATHGYRAYQTPNPGVANPDRGYFLFSGDPDLRWDLAALDESKAAALNAFDSALATAQDACDWLRAKAHGFKASGITDFWGLDKDAVPIPS